MIGKAKAVDLIYRYTGDVDKAEQCYHDLQEHGLFTRLGRLWTAAEVAERYGVSEKRLKNWRENRRGGPRYIKLSGSALYRQEDLLAWEMAILRGSAD